MGTFSAAGIIDASSIRSILSDHAPTVAPVSLNDPAVRGAAGKSTGTVSYSDLYSKQICFVGSITVANYYTTEYGAIRGGGTNGSFQADSRGYWHNGASTAVTSGNINRFAYNSNMGGGKAGTMIQYNLGGGPDS